MLKTRALEILTGVSQGERRQASAPTNLHVISGEVGGTSENGKALVRIDGLVFSGTNSQYVEVDTLGGLEEGDIATILLTGENGHSMTPMAVGSVGSIDRITVRIAAIEADYIKVEQLDAATARIEDLEADHVSVSDLTAATARIGTIEADYLKTADMTAETARVNNLLAGKASVDDLNAATARIGDLEADHVSVSDFEAEQANIDTLQANTADIATIRANSAKVANLTAAELEADHATVGSLDTNYAQINLANVDNAWIQNGTVKDGAITNAMINSVSANKLTAGTIDASNITVTNLNADNITTGTINGQRIGEGSLSLSKLEDDVYTETEVNNIVDNLQSQIDGAIETWTGTVAPTLQNAPAVNWTTDPIKDTHVGDVYFVVNSQSQQNGYNYRFTKTGNTYSWQLIKDNDVTNALQRLTDAEGRIGTIETFDTTVSSFMTNTDAELESIKSAATTLEGRVDTAEGTLATKVDTSTFNTLSQTVEGNSSSIQQLTTETTTLTEKVTLAAPYTQVEWVESNGKQYVYLDWKPFTETFGFEADFIIRNAFVTSAGAWNETTNIDGFGNVFGVRNYSMVNDFQLGSYNTYGVLRFGGGKDVNPRLSRNVRQTCSLLGNSYTSPDGTVTEIVRGTTTANKNYQNMTIFAMYEGATRKSATGNLVQPGSVRIYSLKFYDNDTLAVDLVGAIRNSDKVTGLYDRVSNHFYPAAGMSYGNVTGNLGDSETLLSQLARQNVQVTTNNTDASRLWTAEAPTLNRLEDGQEIVVIARYLQESTKVNDVLTEWDDTTANYNVYLRLILADGNSTDYIPCYYSPTVRLGQHYTNGTPIPMTYRENTLNNAGETGGSSVVRGWFCSPNYNTNNDTITDRITDAAIAGKNGLKPYSLVMKDDEGRWTTLTDISTYNKTNKVPYDGPLQYDNIGYHSTNGSYAAGKEGGVVYNTFSIDFRYSLNITTSAALGLKADIPLFYVGEVHNDGYFYLDNPWYTQTIPTEEDGKTYIYIGTPKDTYRGWLANENTAYRFMDGEFVPVFTHTIQKNTTRISEVEHTVEGISVRIGELETTVETKADGSEVTTISNKLNTVSDTVDGHSQTITSVQSTIDGLGTRVTTAESNITQNANNITTKVSKDGVISSINQSSESVKIQASKVQIDGTAIFTNEDFREAADAAYASKASEALIESANTNANNALQTALDGAFLVLTSTNGQLFKNGTESTILQVAIFPNGGTRCDTIEQVRSRFGSTAYIEWKWMHESSGEWGTLVSTDSHLSRGGMWLTVSPDDVATKTTFAASLVVPD